MFVPYQSKLNSETYHLSLALPLSLSLFLSLTSLSLCIYQFVFLLFLSISLYVTLSLSFVCVPPFHPHLSLCSVFPLFLPFSLSLSLSHSLSLSLSLSPLSPSSSIPHLKTNVIFSGKTQLRNEPVETPRTVRSSSVHEIKPRPRPSTVTPGSGPVSGFGSETKFLPPRQLSVGATRNVPAGKSQNLDPSFWRNIEAPKKKRQ